MNQLPSRSETVDCGRRLCRAEATRLITVGPSNLNMGALEGRETRYYALCEDHANTYAPNAENWLDRMTSARLRTHCVPIPKEVAHA